jgi:hypothetical protein
MFHRIMNNCEPENLYLELLSQGFHHSRKKTFYIQQTNRENVGKLSFEKRLNQILCVLGEDWLDQIQNIVKSLLHNIIVEKIQAKCA